MPARPQPTAPFCRYKAHALHKLTARDKQQTSTSATFEDEVALAIKLKIPLLLVHEQPGLGQAANRAITFEENIAATPRHLLFAKLYNTVATPLKGGVYRHRSLLMLAEDLVELLHVRGETRRASLDRAASIDLNRQLVYSFDASFGVRTPDFDVPPKRKSPSQRSSSKKVMPLAPQH